MRTANSGYEPPAPVLLPAGSMVRAVDSGLRHLGERLLIILSDPSGADWLYSVLPGDPVYRLVGPIGISGTRGFGVLMGGYTSEGLVIAETGRISTIDPGTGATTYQTTIWPAGGPYRCIAEGESERPYATGVGIWRFDGGSPHTGWNVVRWTGFGDVVDLTWIDDPWCYPECDTDSGRSVLDIFDFLCFQNAFAAGCGFQRNRPVVRRPVTGANDLLVTGPVAVLSPPKPGPRRGRARPPPSLSFLDVHGPSAPIRRRAFRDAHDGGAVPRPRRDGGTP